ncbi:MAG: hypothetical protein ABIS36_24825 [Chryseolinea sp.]
MDAVNNSTSCKENISIFKVPHHGSSNGYHESFSKRKLSKQVISAVTAFSPHGLPRDEEISRILEYSERAFLTTLPKGRQPIKHSRDIDKLLAKLGKAIIQLPTGIGHIQITRNTTEAKSNVNIFGAAKELHRGNYLPLTPKLAT